MLYRPSTNDVGGVAINYKMRGKVKSWNQIWGMITAVDNQTETTFLFTFEDLVRKSEFRDLKENEFVRFDIGEGIGKDGKAKAINVKRLYVAIFSAHDIFEYQSTSEDTGAGEWLDSTLNPGEFVPFTESSCNGGVKDQENGTMWGKGIPFLEDERDANNYPIEEILEFLDGVEPLSIALVFPRRFLEFKRALEQSQGESPDEEESFLESFSKILHDMRSALEADPGGKAEFERFSEENEKMRSIQATEEFEAEYNCPRGYLFNPKDNGKYKQLMVDHLRHSLRSEWAQESLLDSIDEFKESYWDALEETEEVDSWIEYIREEGPYGTPSIYCCIMALEFVEVTEFDRPGGCPLDLVDFSSEVELVGKYDIEVTAVESDPSSKILVTENGLTVLEDYRKRRIGTGLVSKAEEFIKSKLGTMAVGGLTKICFLAHCDNQNSSDLFEKLGYTLVTEDSASVQDLGRIDFDPEDSDDELSEHWLNETIA